jgi:hypothetical protein
MIKELDISEHNKQVYIEFFKDIQARGNGLFSFVIQMSAGEIVSYVIVDNIPPQDFVDEPIFTQSNR